LPCCLLHISYMLYVMYDDRLVYVSVVMYALRIAALMIDVACISLGLQGEVYSLYGC